VVWWSAANTDNWVATPAAAPKDKRYSEVFHDGYALKRRRSTTDMPLTLYHNAVTGHTLTVASVAGHAFAATHNFSTVAALGYLCAEKECRKAPVPSPPSPPSPPPILEGLPGAIIDECRKYTAGGGWIGTLSINRSSGKSSWIPDSVLESGGSVVSGNLRVTPAADGSGALGFVRESDGVTLVTIPAPIFNDTASSISGFWAMEMDTVVPVGRTDRVYGLGQIEGTSSGGGVRLRSQFSGLL
jgi:hypothetical protein